ncbi:MAG TPA: hypothetical protein PLW80_11405, partial [Spirochaetales bacterium]|nr:hypothetical protein [Spirochaetales bacterium]
VQALAFAVVLAQIMGGSEVRLDAYRVHDGSSSTIIPSAGSAFKRSSPESDPGKFTAWSP